jgi:type IV pilus assembly protein PilP
MKIHPFATAKWICLLGALMLLAGCGNTDTAQAQTQVVRKKIDESAARANPAPPPLTAVAPQPAAPSPEANPAAAPGVANPASVPATASPPPPAVAVAQAAAAAPPPAASPPAAVARPETLPNPTESQVAALLNIQAPAPYNPKGKINPFEPLIGEVGPQDAVGALRLKKRNPQSPLEKLDMAQLKLVAILQAPSGNRAVVEDSSGKGYIVKEGTYLGLNSGKVVGIQLDKVTIEEEYEDIKGNTIVKKNEITLPKPPGEL